MKNLILRAAALFFLSVPAFAQPETLFDGDITSGGYGGPALKVTSVNQEPAVMIGASGAWVINSSYSVGLGGYGLVNDVPVSFSDESPDWYAFAYGGVILGYQFFPDKLVHLGVQTLVGGGGMAFRPHWEEDVDFENDLDNSDPVFVMEPGLTAELNISRTIRLHLEASYRLVSGVEPDVDMPGLNNDRLSGPAGTLTLKFGSF